MDLSEKETRELLIDKELKRRGWLKNYIKEEVHSVVKKAVMTEFRFIIGIKIILVGVLLWIMN